MKRDYYQHYLSVEQDNITELQYSLEQEIYDLDAYTTQVSIEGAFDNFKKRIKNIYDVLRLIFKKIYLFFKNKIVTWWRSKRTRHDIKKLEELLKIGYLTKGNITSLIDMFFVNGTLNGKTVSYYFTEDGKMRNVDTLISRVENAVNQITDFKYSDEKFVIGMGCREFFGRYEYQSDKKPFNANAVSDDGSSFFEEINSMSFYKLIETDILDNHTTKGGVEHQLGEYDISKKITQEHLLEAVKTLDKDFDKANNHYEKVFNNLNKKIEDIEKQLSGTENENAKKELTVTSNIFKLAMKVAYIPAAIMVGYIRLIQYISNTAVSEEYTTTTEVPFNTNHIYHLSGNSGLKSPMKPRVGGTNYNEFLPARVSFSVEPLNACYGIPRYFAKPDGKDNGLFYKDIYLYEGKIEKGKTKFIKPELMFHSIPGTIQHTLKEVSVASDIQIEKKGKIRIFYKSDRSLFNKGNYVKWEHLDK